ncbi:tyrosine-type recombinase/integrase [Hyphomicrobium sp. xq]|uniref:Tyrosine-type recombinase/integrase n=1 Tax=Hyphomicrobium album TaxID=2665159 RepID=A0A6I3KHE3_9HYPH|nr:tyrosine-type recombinase/integrase [Hyphomicrobium album]MTD93928.1 tyrosine-type recombinase/integrase [Hyphomicrobium album]
MVKVEYPYVQVFRDRHGRTRLYYRRASENRVSLRGPLGSADFEQDYRAALSASAAGQLAQPTPANPRTYKWLCLKYLKSADFLRLDPGTQRTRELIIEHTWAEPIAPGSAVLIGDCPLNRFSPKIVRVLRDRKMKFPHAANGRVKNVRRIFKWAMENEHIEANPARDVQYLKTSGSGYHTWTDDEIAQFENHWPVGSKARLAFALLRYLGVRRSDVVAIGRQHVRGGWLRFTTKKCKTPLELPMPSALQTVIESSETGDLTYLLTEYGKSFADAGFGNWFRERCDAAGLPHCSAHGLRKAAATALADAGATAHQLMAWFGWKSLKEAERYTRMADQKRLAASVVTLIEKCRSGE